LAGPRIDCDIVEAAASARNRRDEVLLDRRSPACLAGDRHLQPERPCRIGSRELVVNIRRVYAPHRGNGAPHIDAELVPRARPSAVSGPGGCRAGTASGLTRCAAIACNGLFVCKGRYNRQRIHSAIGYITREQTGRKIA
jgi:hypothetical protein